MQVASTLLLWFKSVTEAPKYSLNVEIGLQNVSLSIPFLVLSTEVKISGDVEKHILTPFGYVDIVFPNVSDQTVASFPSEIQVVGDIDSWMLDEAMPSEFRVSILGLIGEIANSHFGCLPLDSRWTSVRFKSGSRDVSVMWERCPRREVV
jgi:hypothetical protein